jgi:glycosyltransferase involved in cell wall biosynthesis
MKKNASRLENVTLLFPCFNEHQHLTESVENIFRVLRTSRFSFEVIFIDDNSTDGTQQLLGRIVKSYPHTRLILHTYNQGRGACVTEGIRMATSQIVGFLDIDCEASPVYIPLFVDEILRGADIVVGHRYYPTELNLSSLIRDVTSTFYAFFVRVLLHLSVRDTEAGYKFFRRKKIMPILATVKDTRWFWDTEIIAQSSSQLSIHEMPILFLRNKNKTSTVNLLRDGVGYIVSLYRYISQR